MAAAIDAEGWLGSSKENGFQPALTITNTNKDWLEWFRSVFGGHIYSDRRLGSPSRKRAYKWTITKSADLAYLLGECLSFLKIKTQQAILVQRLCIRKGRAPRRLSQEEFECRLAIYNELKCLNLKGDI